MHFTFIPLESTLYFSIEKWYIYVWMSEVFITACIPNRIFIPLCLQLKSEIVDKTCTVWNWRNQNKYFLYFHIKYHRKGSISNTAYSINTVYWCESANFWDNGNFKAPVLIIDLFHILQENSSYLHMGNYLKLLLFCN